MRNHHLVRPEHLNQYGYLFGGSLLAWVDEDCWIAATQEFPGCKFVTVGMDQVEFHYSVKEGTILRSESTRVHLGKTSLTYQVVVTDARRPDAPPIFATRVSYVNVDETGAKKEIPRPQ